MSEQKQSPLVADLLPEPTNFTDEQLSEFEALERKRAAYDPMWPFGMDAVLMKALIANARLVNQRNRDGIYLYNVAHRNWVLNHRQNPGRYGFDLKPKPGKLLKMALVVDGEFMWPKPIETDEMVCDEIAYTEPTFGAGAPLGLPVVANYQEPNPHYPDEYPCRPTDTVLVGTKIEIMTSDGPKLAERRERATPWGAYKYYKVVK